MARAEAKYVIRADDKTRGAINAVKKNFGGLARHVTKVMGPLAAGASVAGIVAMGKRSLDAADQVGKLAGRLGASTEALSQYRHVADRSGISFQTLTMGWQRMTRRVAEAANGTGEARGALKELGLEAKSLNQLRPEQQFEVLADALKNVENPADRVRLAMKLFDAEGVSLIQTMEGGSAGIREMRKEADRLGMTLSEDQTKAAAAANDAMAKLKTAMGGLGNLIAVALGPALAAVANWLADALPKAAEFAVKAFHKVKQFAVNAVEVIISKLTWATEKLSQLPDWLGGEKFTQWTADLEDTRTKLQDLGKDMEVATGKAREFSIATGTVTTALEQQSNVAATQSHILGKTAEDYKALQDAYISGEAAWERMRVAHQGAANAASNVAGRGKEAVDVLNNGARSAAESIANGLGNAITAAGEKLIDLGNIAKSVFSSIIGGLARLGIGLGLNALIPGAGTVLGLVGRAGGGSVTAGTPYMVGEQGRELFVPRTAGTIVPESKLGGTNVTQNVSITVPVQGDVYASPLARRRLAEMLQDELERVRESYRDRSAAYA